MIGPDERPYPVQAASLQEWPDGSIRWMLVDFLADWDGSTAETTYHLRLSQTDSPPGFPAAAVVSREGDLVRVSTGAAVFDLRIGGLFPFKAVRGPGEAAIVDDAGTRLMCEGDSGRSAFRLDGVSVESAGPLRIVLRVEGRADRGGPSNLQLIARLHFFAGSPVVQFLLTMRNRRAARHPGGIWELGEPAAVLLRDLTFTVTAPEARRGVACSIAPGAPLVSVDGALEVFQASSGGANWASSTHINRQGAVPLAFRGYRVRTALGEERGDRAVPLVSIADGSLSVTMPLFWQFFPAAIEASPSAISLRLLPRQHNDLHELQPGEQVTHTFAASFGEDRIGGVPLEWARTPCVARLTPEAYCASGALPYLIPQTEDPNVDYLALVAAAIEGSDTFEHKRELIDEYGWRSFGDLYADHESAHYAGPAPVVSHYNNQYDAVAGLALQFMRSGDLRWWRLMTALTRHVVDIDIYHTDGDRAAYNHGLFWHTAHYADAGRSTHRTYPRAPGVSGGGPANEHNYAGGLLLHYFLTGEESSREAILGLARWVVDMDDGGKSSFRFLASGDTGLASATGTADYHGPGRGAGNSIAVLVTAWTISGEPLFLQKAQALIRRCVHPRDDIDAHTLLDAENRWSYTVFLVALGQYLDVKLESGQVDADYEYARQSLVAYARWMCLRERPYLDHPDALQFPTETWVAQELWKAEALAFGAKYDSAATPLERAGFLQRSTEFFDYAIRTLRESPTRTYTRPLVLLLSHGLMGGFVLRHPGMLAAPSGPAIDAGSPGPPFEPQKTRALRRALALAALLLVLMAAGAAVIALWWLR